MKTRLRLSLALVLARACLGRPSRGRRLPADAVLAAVPASRASLRRRGMNPAMEIARSLAEALDLPCGMARCCVCAKRHGRRGLEPARAPRALAGVFRGQGVRGRHVALVDDVMTTGSTAGSRRAGCWRPARSA